MVSYVYDLPSVRHFHAFQWMPSRVTDGWNVSGITTLQSGFPLDVVDSAFPSLTSWEFNFYSNFGWNHLGCAQLCRPNSVHESEKSRDSVSRCNCTLLVQSNKSYELLTCRARVPNRGLLSADTWHRGQRGPRHPSWSRPQQFRFCGDERYANYGEAPSSNSVSNSTTCSTTPSSIRTGLSRTSIPPSFGTGDCSVRSADHPVGCKVYVLASIFP